MNNLETKLTITGAFVAILFGVYYLNKNGTKYWANKSIKDIANEFSTANKRDQKRMLGELSAKQINDMREELRSMNNNNIAKTIKAEEAYEEWAETNNQQVDDKRKQLLNKLLENKSHSGNSFLSKKTGDRLFDELEKQNENYNNELDSILKKNTGKGNHNRTKKHKRSKKHKRR
jgi:hypothetical protein